MFEYLKRELQDEDEDEDEDEGDESIFIKENSINEKYQTNKKKLPLNNFTSYNSLLEI